MKDTNYELTDIELFENDSHTVAMYSFFDQKSSTYDTPFFCQNDMFAGRHYVMATDKKGTMLNTFKKDFDLIRLGFFNHKTGEFTEYYEVIVSGKTQTQEEK
jgi:hypothetical protein